MKTFFSFLLCATALGLSALTSTAQQVSSPRVDSAGGTWNATASYAVLSADSAGSLTPTVTCLSAASDLAGSKVTYYNVGNPTFANYVSTTTSLPVNTTNGFASGDVIVIRHVAADTYERRVLTTFTSSTNLTVTVAPTAALAVGDQVWDAQVCGAIPWGASTNTISGPGIIAGQRGKPLLMDITGTASCNIWSACAIYQ